MAVGEPQGDRLLANQLDADAGAVVGDHDHDLRSVALQADRDAANVRLAGRRTAFRGLDAVHHRVAQHVLERRDHALQHLPIEFRGSALNDQFRTLAGVVRRLTHEAREPLHMPLEGHHARPHQAILQLGDDARLLGEQILRFASQCLEEPLDAGHVTRGLGERARILLQGGISVQLERIEVAAPGLRILMPVEDLRFGLHLEAAQLLFEARHRARQLRQIEVDRVDLLIDASPEYAHLSGIVEHGVEQIRIDARHFHPFHRGALASRQHRSAAELETRDRLLARGSGGRLRNREGAARIDGFCQVGCGRGRRCSHRRRGRRHQGHRRRRNRRGGDRRHGRRHRSRRRRGRWHPGRNGRRGDARNSRRIRQIADLRDQRRRTHRHSAVAHQIAHAREFVETGLHDRVGMVVAGHGAAVDLQHQGLEFMTQVAHGADARHSGAAFEGMQLTLQFRDSLFVLAVAIPGGQRAFSGLQQFGRFFAVDVGDFVIELLRRRRRSGLLRNRRQCGDHGRRARVDGLAGNRGVEFGFDVVQPREQRGLFREKCRRFVDVRYHVVDRADRVRQSRKPTIRQPMTAVEDLAHDLIQGLGDADAVPRLGHLRAAAQGMDGAIHGLRQIVRRRLARALAQVFADLAQMARRLLAVNVMQHGIHHRRCGGDRGRSGG